MGKDGSSGGPDTAYNSRIATLSEFTAGLGFNDYLRRYGYQLSPQYGGITNPMASFKAGQGAIPGIPAQSGFFENAISAVNNVSGFNPTSNNYGYDYIEPVSGQPVTLGFGNNTLSSNKFLPVQQQPQAQPTGTFAGTGAGMALPNMGLPAGSPFVQAVDRYGNPIISAIDIEDQANRLNYGLAPVQAQYMTQGLESSMRLMPHEESAAIAGLGAAEALGLGRQTVMPGQIGAVQAQNAALTNRLQQAGDQNYLAQQQAIARGEATANVQQAFNPAMLRTQLTRAGQGTQSGQFTNAMAKLAFERSKALAGGRYMATQDTTKRLRDEEMKLIGTGVSALPVA